MVTLAKIGLIKILAKGCREKKGKFHEFVYLQLEKESWDLTKIYAFFYNQQLGWSMLVL